MSDDLTNKILDRYGFLGIFALALSFGILFLIWVLVSITYPIALLMPILIVFWMVWQIKGGKNE